MNRSLSNLTQLKSFASLIFNRVANDKSYEHPFFLIEIIQRRKDNPALEAPYKTLKWFAVYSSEELTELCSPTGEITEYCNKTNSRAYFHVNIKDSRATVNGMLYLISKWSNINNNTLNQLPECFYIAARQQEANIKLDNMFWVIDFDYKDGFEIPDDSSIALETINPESPGAFYEDGFINSVRKKFIEFITQNLQEEKRDFYFVNSFTVKTNQGFHIVIPPFDLTKEVKRDLPKFLEDEVKDFKIIVKEEIRLLDRIKKNNSTILYKP